jgi:hypothetical protein
VHANAHMPVAPLKALQNRATDVSRWILFDPELAADCLSAYRAVRLMLLAAFALIAASLRAEKIANAEDGRETVLELSAKAKPAAMKQARVPLARTLAAASTQPRLEFRVSRKQAMACLEMVRAHAPPQCQISYNLIRQSPLHNLPPPCGSHAFSAATLLFRRSLRLVGLDRPPSMSVFYFQGEIYVR